jgi:hypothetical protein
MSYGKHGSQVYKSHIIPKGEATMFEIAGGIILAVFGLIAIVVVLCVMIRIVSSVLEFRPRFRQSTTIPWYGADRKTLLRLAIGMAVYLGIVSLSIVVLSR